MIQTQAILVEVGDEFEESMPRAMVGRCAVSTHRRESTLREIEKSYVRPEVIERDALQWAS